MNARPTTAELQTPPGAGGIAVIALAGPRAEDILDGVFRPLRAHARAGEATLQLGRLHDGQRTIDEAIVHRGRRAVEINIHGGPAAARATLKLLAARGAAVVPAEPGRAFEPAHPRQGNPAVGREMLQALPAARSLLVATALSRQWAAGLSALARDTCSALTGEAPLGTRPADRLRRAAAGLARMARLLDPPEVVIAGPPNAGKSTLANALVGRAVSIVHDRPGTTRDWVREPAILRGVPLWLTDTAGLWEPPCPVDAEAVRRARHCAEGADLVLLAEPEAPAPLPGWLHARRLLRVQTKFDVHPPRGRADVRVSAVTGAGLDALREAVLAALRLADVDPGEPMAFTRRQADLLTAAADAMERGKAPGAVVHLKSLLVG